VVFKNSATKEFPGINSSAGEDAECEYHYRRLESARLRGNLGALRHLLKVLGDDWGFILTDVTLGPAGNDERQAFLFDTRRVKLSGLACELVVWRYSLNSA
jgi:hypothetical protein